MANIYKFRQWSLTVLRIVLGIIFTFHGYLKLFVVGGLPGTAQFLSFIGIPLANYAAVLVAFVEFFGGIFLILGFLSKWSSAALIIEMLVALFMVHIRNGFLIGNGGSEFVLLIIFSLSMILLNGPGNLSLGRYVFENMKLGSKSRKKKSRRKR
jgi:putative oxidoreductase|tara:strand:+ start:5813 stop:6274 length:462 start_codon:yes stop_codon:yes gene_type:complete